MDYFSHITGNEAVKKKLCISLQKKAWNLPLCFQGVAGLGKSLFAKAYARAILGRDAHPDMLELHPVGKLGLHAIEAVRAFCAEAYIAPYAGDHKVLIIHEADRMLPSSANALLKTLEEPGEGTVIILLTSSVERILPTIRSRVRTIYFDPLPGEEIKVSPAMELIELFMAKKLSYMSLKGFLNEMEARKKKSVPEELPQEMSAKQRAELEKLFEGQQALEAMREAKLFLQTLLTFFRDLHVIYHGGSRSLLMHPHLAPQMFDIATAKEPIALEKLEGATIDAYKSLERSIPLASCVENLFLKLNLV